MMMEGEPWEDYHHRSHLPNHLEDYSNKLNHPSVLDFLLNYVFIDIVDSKRNLSNIKETISINISTKHNIVETFMLANLVLHQNLTLTVLLFMNFKIYLHGHTRRC